MILTKFPVKTENGEYKVTVVEDMWGVDIKIFTRKQYKVPFTGITFSLFRKVVDKKYWPNVLRVDFGYSVKEFVASVVGEYEKKIQKEAAINSTKTAGIKEFTEWNGVVS